MKVLIITPDSDIDRRTVAIANSLAGRGDAVSIVCMEGGSPVDFSGKFHGDIRIFRTGSAVVRTYRNLMRQAGGDLYRYVSCAGRFLIKIFRIPAMEYVVSSLVHEARKHEADLIIACDLPALEAAVKVRLFVNRTGRVPLIYDSHELYPEQSNLGKSVMKRLLKKEKTLLAETDAVILPNFMMREYFAKTRKPIIEKERIFVIRNAALPKKPVVNRVTRKLFRTSIGLDERTKVILFHGGITPLRNLESLVEAQRYLDSMCRIVLMGQGPLLEELRMRAGKMKNAPVFHPPVPQEVLIETVAQSDAGIIPYTDVDENFRMASPNKFYEFIQARVPVVASNRLSYLSMAISSAGNGVVADLSTPCLMAGAISETLEIFSRDDEGRPVKKELARCLEKVAEDVSWEVEEKKLFEVISFLV